MQQVGFLPGDELQPLAAAVASASGLPGLAPALAQTSPDADQGQLFTAPLADDVTALVHLLMAGHVPSIPLASARLLGDGGRKLRARETEKGKGGKIRVRAEFSKLSP